MTKTEVATIQAVINRLRCEPFRLPDGRVRKGESDEVHRALTGPARFYLETWVIGALELLLPGDDRDPAAALRIVVRH